MTSRKPAPTPEPAPRPKPRHYLRAAERHRQLIDAAARIAGREGLDRLSMVGVATEAGVSRQLVYEHFPDLSAMVVALLFDRFGEIDATIAKAVADARGGGLDEALLAARGILSLPTEHRHILRVLLAHAGIPEHELSVLAARLRARTTERWTSMLRAEEDPNARALTWALANAMLGLGDLVDAAELTLEQALQQLSKLITAAFPHLSLPSP
ncbi:MAG: TetR/AcrR family transcriptional regulator [Solirubrobacteraceae bacterium]|jgi:AcrR family transcriptional regulator